MQPSHLIAPLVVAALVGLAALAYRGHVRMQAEARALDGAIVAEYFALVLEERYAEAHERCLSAEYRGRLGLEPFAQRLRQRREQLGPLLGRELRTIQSSRNLFSKTRTFQLQYVLRYAKEEQVRVLALSDADGAMRVDGTYVEGASDTLDSETW